MPSASTLLKRQKYCEKLLARSVEVGTLGEGEFRPLFPFVLW